MQLLKVLLSQDVFFLPFLYVCVCCLKRAEENLIVANPEKMSFHFIFVKAASQLNLLFILES